MRRFTVMPKETREGITNNGTRPTTIMLLAPEEQKFYSNLGEVKFPEVQSPNKPLEEK